MSYRDENDALRARVESLETELRRARAERAQGPRTSLSVVEPGGLFRGGTELVFDVELAQEVGDAFVEDLVSELRERVGVLGRTEVLGQTVEWRSEPARGQVAADVALRVAVRRGRTRLRLRQSFAARRSAGRASAILWPPFLAFLFLVVWGIFVRGRPAAALWMMAALTPVTVALVQLSYRRRVRKAHARLADLLRRSLAAVTPGVRVAEIAETAEPVAVDVTEASPRRRGR
ncbi:MAG: hypothetical protein AAGH15_01115 [Myxococcota bacterium]